MSQNPLFSAYRHGENRVTSSMLAVFERIELSLLETLLTAATEEAGNIQMVTFVNQPQGCSGSVPDAHITGMFTYWFEVKTTRNALREDQIREHVANLGTSGGDERLFIITPDASKPRVLESIEDNRVIWFNFKSLSDAIDHTLDDASDLIPDAKVTLVPERTRFLLRELQALFVKDALLDTDDVVIVAARIAYPEYFYYGAYVCQPNRSFREGLTHLGFYAQSAIQPEVARIRWREEAVPFTQAEMERRSETAIDKRMATLIETHLKEGTRHHGSEYQVFLLSEPDSDDTLRLEAPIKNDQTGSRDQPVAWTRGHRYVSRERLVRPGLKVTSAIWRSDSDR